MQHTLAVYTSKPSLSGRKLADVAKAQGVLLRYLALDIYIPSLDMQDAALSSVYGGARIVVGAFDSDSESLAQFDQLVGLGDRKPIVDMLSAGKLRWCELYAQRFSYDAWIKRVPQDRAKIDDSVPPHLLPIVKTSKVRYIVDNQSQSTFCRQLMTRLTDLLAEATAGVVSDHQQPSR